MNTIDLNRLAATTELLRSPIARMYLYRNLLATAQAGQIIIPHNLAIHTAMLDDAITGARQKQNNEMSDCTGLNNDRKGK
jgi:hypothetical protein